MHRILLVEDEPNNLALVLANLRGLLPHCQFDSAACVRHARALLEDAFKRDRPYFAAVLDLFLPEEPGGTAVFEGLRNTPKMRSRSILAALQQYAPHTHLIVHTSYKDQPEVQSALEELYRTAHFTPSKNPGEPDVRGNDILVEKKNPRADLLIAGHILAQRLVWWRKVQAHLRSRTHLPEEVICREPHHMEAEIAAELRTIWRNLDEDNRKRICVTLEIDESHSADSNAPDMGMPAYREMLRKFATEELKELRATRHFHIHHALRGTNRIKPAHLDAYAEALDRAYDLLVVQRGAPPPASASGPVDVYVAEMHCDRFTDPRPHTSGTPDGDCWVVLPSEPTFPHSPAEIAAHECAHLFNSSVGSTGRDWGWFEEATALLFELQFHFGEDFMAKAVDDHRAHPWLVRQEVSVFEISSGFCGFPGAAFLWFLIAPEPAGCGLGTDFLSGVWKSAAAVWEREKPTGALGISVPPFDIIDAELAGRGLRCRELFGYGFARRSLFLWELFPSLAADPRFHDVSPADRATLLSTDKVTMPASWGCLFIRLAAPETPTAVTVKLQAVNNGESPSAVIDDVRAQLLYCVNEQPAADVIRLQFSAPESAVPDSPRPLVGSLPLPALLPAEWCIYLIIANTAADPPQAQQTELARPKLSVTCGWS